MYRMKKVYCYETINGKVVSPYFLTRKSATGWNKEHKEDQTEPILLFKKEISKKRYKECFGNFKVE